jgi:hypothetical protein
LSIIQKSLTDIKTSINHVELDLKNLKQKQEKNDQFAEVMESFMKDAKSRYETLECMFQKMNEAYKDLADFYTFEQSKYSLGEFFTDLKTFTNQFNQCVDENIRLKEAEEKLRRAEEERKQREKEVQARRCQKEKLMQSSISNSESGMGDGTGVMDNLLEALQSGKFFEGSASNNANNRLLRGRRPARDLEYRRTLHKKSPLVIQ